MNHCLFHRHVICDSVINLMKDTFVINMFEYDVAIIGGGPIGGFIGQKLAVNKINVALFEKNKEIGLPLNCAGLVSPRVFDIVDIHKDKIIQNKIKGANIHSPSNHILTIGGDKTHALAIDRTLFDKEIIKKAENKGCKIFVGNNVLSMQKINNHIELRTSKNHDIQCSLLIGADGPFSKVRDRFVLPEPKEYLRGIGAELKGTNLNPDFIEIFVGNNTAPGFFAWIIPTNKNGTNARAGLCIKKDSEKPPKYYFSKFLQKKEVTPFIKDSKITQHIGGIIPLGVLKKTYSSNLMVVGDAAAQVKPTSGGGIYSGLLCAKHCANTAINSFENKDFSFKSLKKYHKLFLNDFGREFNLGMKFRRIFKNLSDNQMDKYLQKFQNPEIIKVISKYGDIDYPSKLIKPLLKKAPTLLKLAPSAIKD